MLHVVFKRGTMAAAASLSLMKSADLIKKEPLDYGGFGEVYLCYHKTLGQVVLKTVYTGPPRNGRQKQCLLDEGSLMSRLNHQRVVKLLGVILEDGDYSLVMELIPKGNLLSMLETVPVPISVKGRIVLEILEGMVYLTENQVIHKDLKPENILVDKNFHIKIADLGLATSQVWSKLTKEESRRQSGLGKKSCARAAGTLCYMAPEHLKSINTCSTEKSDVYSFSIVVWVILSGREPYENARSEDQICHCVCQGERPDEALIPQHTPQDVIELMKTCWNEDPRLRPTFKGRSLEGSSWIQNKAISPMKPRLRPPEVTFGIKSCPDSASHAAESFMLDSQPGLRLSPVVCPPSDSGWPVTISNASAIQIGSYNTMNLRVSDNSSFSSLSTGSSNRTRYNKLLLKYEEHTVTESHLEVVRQNVGGNWKQVARKLGLSDIDVDTVEHDYDRDGLAEKVHQTLERWKMKEGLLGITMGKLCRALEGCIKPSVLLQLLLKSQHTAGVP
ncbi:receptor-interacting serine/threonine-protein kinase 1-like [Sinocyclocheilus anshuiensis]|uniref:receptor-interacting serine/threonine-protein kinase 1-like n=1 Tax=Sinocyclocheilus anshuiensis TaxID=1608454 RepID=UPI0007B90B18|nr:PREDICTED: receptor-interacting serine/threonine-protein kinase 1-like [Sinocyclocheilus anshuiensis]